MILLGESNLLTRGLWVDSTSPPENYALYENADQLLFLTDGRGWQSLGRAVAQRFPGKFVFRADKLEPTLGDFASPRDRPTIVDNTRPFPFEDNQFQSIVARDSMCFHNGRWTSCGGISSTRLLSQRFFNEVIRVLDKTNPQSFAFLHGKEIPQRAVQNWREALTRASQREAIQWWEVRASNHSQDNATIGFLIVPDNTEDSIR